MYIHVHLYYRQEACPLYNEQNRKFLLANIPSQERNAQKYNVKILHQFHSALEHTFLWVVEADSPHLIEELMELNQTKGFWGFNQTKDTEEEGVQEIKPIFLIELIQQGILKISDLKNYLLELCHLRLRIEKQIEKKTDLSEEKKKALAAKIIQKCWHNYLKNKKISKKLFKN